MNRSFGAIASDKLVYGLLLIAAAACAWLAHGKQQLRRELAQTRYELSHSKVGDWLPATTAAVLQDPDGEKATLAAPARGPQILYFFSPECRFCKASEPHIERIYDNAKAGGVEMYAVSIVGEAATRKYLRDSGSLVPTVVLPRKRDLAVYRISAVPTLLVVDAQGKIQYARYGLISDKDVPKHGSVPAQGRASGAP